MGNLLTASTKMNGNKKDDKSLTREGKKKIEFSEKNLFSWLCSYRIKTSVLPIQFQGYGTLCNCYEYLHNTEVYNNNVPPVLYTADLLSHFPCTVCV